MPCSFPMARAPDPASAAPRPTHDAIDRDAAIGPSTPCPADLAVRRDRAAAARARHDEPAGHPRRARLHHAPKARGRTRRTHAVEALEQYAQTRNEDHFDRYIEEARVVAGARMARIELEKPFPISTSPARGLLRCAQSPGRHRRHDRPVPPLSSGRLHGAAACEIWTEADALFAGSTRSRRRSTRRSAAAAAITGDLEPAARRAAHARSRR